MRPSPKRRGIGAAALFLSLGLILAGCSGEGSGGDVSDMEVPGPEVLEDLDEAVQVEFWHSMDATNRQVLDELIADFNTENEGRIEVSGAFQATTTPPWPTTEPPSSRARPPR